MKNLRQEIVNFINKTDASLTISVVKKSPEAVVIAGKMLHELRGIVGWKPEDFSQEAYNQNGGKT